ncbi:hypothetical protein [Desulfitibacter alkalitolerans]|uniref:hypothetical protein n=1 Tax=Desulfitibacter alkalitolerans TaxID=264641 RepID=UPI000488DBF9|nr:hypothetical protein [Desulfitibacter alkalitolerans]
MEYIAIAWIIFGQIINTLLGIKGIVLYLLGLFLLAALDGYQFITYMQFSNIVIATTALIIILLTLIFFRKKIWGRYNMPVNSLVLMGISSIFIIGSLTKPSIGLMAGGTIMVLPIGRVILYKGFLGIFQLYIMSFLQWFGVLLINLYIFWSIIGNLT